jgi:hypothetical protein
MIPLCNIAIGLKVGTGLFAIFVALSVFKISKKEKYGPCNKGYRLFL